MIVVSACLIGENCKYNGGNNETLWVKDFILDKNYLAVCPERTGGLPVPRPPSELRGEKVINDLGEDVTKEFVAGADKELLNINHRAAELKEKIELAILKAKSPTCGCGKVYDGEFTGTLIEGNGIFANLLLSKGIKVITEEE